MLQHWQEKDPRPDLQRAGRLADLMSMVLSLILWVVQLGTVLLLLTAGVRGETCTIVSNHDGDSLTAHCNGMKVHVRLSSVDAPELGQPFGTEAQRFTESLTQGREVELKTFEVDKYRRTVAAVTLPDGSDLARELVKAGLAWHYVKYSKDRELATIEQEARTARRGLWGDETPQWPGAFRHRNDSAQVQPDRIQ